MPRRQAAHATAATEAVREAVPVTRQRMSNRTQAWTKRLTKRVVSKPDGRYLIYYDKA